MKNSATQLLERDCLPYLSSETQGWENIVVEQFQHPAGEENCHNSSEHTICLSLASRPVRFLQIQGGKTYTGLYSKGDISITAYKNLGKSSSPRPSRRYNLL
jgi:AraC family transcriptional regulator